MNALSKAFIITALSLAAGFAGAKGGASSGGGHGGGGGGHSSSSSAGRSSGGFSSAPASRPAPAPVSAPRPAPAPTAAPAPKTTTTTTTTTTRSVNTSSRYVSGGGVAYGGMGTGYGYNNGLLTGVIIGNMMHPQHTVVYAGGGSYNNNALLYPDGRVVNQQGQQVGTYQNGQFTETPNGGMAAQPVPQDALHPPEKEKSVGDWMLDILKVMLLIFIIVFLILFLRGLFI